MVLCVSGPETIGHGPTASPTGKLDPPPRAQTVALSAGGHAGVRSLVRGLPAELAKPGRNDGRAWCCGRPCNCSPLGPEDLARLGRGVAPTKTRSWCLLAHG